MTSFTKREQIVILIFVIVVISIFGFNMLTKDHIVINEPVSKLNEDNILLNNPESAILNTDIEENASESITIMVHISGQVHNPGLVILDKGSRLVDAVNKAGGLIQAQVDMNRINLAKKLNDEEKIYIPKIGEELEDKDDTVYLNNPDSYNNNIKMININSATKNELISLPGIGEVTADKIIEYRKTNRFTSIKDIMNVNGIGEKKYESIQGLITVN